MTDRKLKPGSRDVKNDVYNQVKIVVGDTVMSVRVDARALSRNEMI